MNTRRRFFSPVIAKAALALGALSGFAFAPQAAFADLPIITLGTFHTTNGASPINSVTFDSLGNLYGTTIHGGASGVGTVFEVVNAAAPEPSQAAMLGLALIGLMALLLRTRRGTGEPVNRNGDKKNRAAAG